MNVPKDLKYTKDHEWVKIEGDIAVIGITDFAQGELGDIVYVEVHRSGCRNGNQLLWLIVHQFQYTLAMLLCTKREAQFCAGRLYFVQLG